MRSQVLHDDVDERSWRLPRVDPTGWLAGPEGAGTGPGEVDAGPRGDGVRVAPAPVRRRRPRRTAAARAARERELARRRRRRHGRVVAVDEFATAVARPGGRLARPASAIGRVADPAGRGERSAPNPGYRIGRWGRLALTVLALATLMLLVGRLVTGAMGGAAAHDPVDVTVRPGDTLWSIATSASPDRDPRAVIDDIREFNHLSGDLVRVGEVLRVPGAPG